MPGLLEEWVGWLDVAWSDLICSSVAVSLGTVRFFLSAVSLHHPRLSDLSHWEGGAWQRWTLERRREARTAWRRTGASA